MCYSFSLSRLKSYFCVNFFPSSDREANVVYGDARSCTQPLLFLTSGTDHSSPPVITLCFIKDRLYEHTIYYSWTTSGFLKTDTNAIFWGLKLIVIC